MGNCLVTKLKGTVDNDNLLKVGEYKMHFNLSAARNMKFFTDLAGTGDYTILGDNDYYFTKNGQQSKTVKMDSDLTTFPAGEYDVLFTEKYHLQGCDSVVQLDLEMFRYANKTAGMYIGGDGQAKGNIDALKDKNLIGVVFAGGDNQGVYGKLSDLPMKFMSYSLGYTSLEGDIALFGKTGNKDISVVNCPNITGSLESLIVALASDPDNPFTNGQKRINIAGSGVTINGKMNTVADENLYVVMTDATHWYYPSNGNSKIEDPSQRLTIYAMNPTAAQIAAWEANNNTVVTLS